LNLIAFAGLMRLLRATGMYVSEDMYLS